MCIKDLAECDCSCHRTYRDKSWPFAETGFGGIVVAHVSACCSTCFLCGTRVRAGMMNAHASKCPAQMDNDYEVK